MIAWYASSHSFRKAVDYYSYTTAYTVVGIASLISSEHNYQDDSCTNHSLVTWPACFRPDLNPDLLRGRQVLIPLCHPTVKTLRETLRETRLRIKAVRDITLTLTLYYQTLLFIVSGKPEILCTHPRAKLT